MTTMEIIRKVNNDIIDARRELERAVLFDMSKSTYYRRLKALRELEEYKDRIEFQYTTKCTGKTVKEIIEANKDCKFARLINNYSGNIYHSGPLYPTETYPNFNLYEELTTGYDKDKKVDRYVRIDDHVMIYTIGF